MTRVLTYMENWKNWKTAPSQGVVKRDWVPTGRIDFATRLNGTLEDFDQPSEFKLLVEERRIPSHSADQSTTEEGTEQPAPRETVPVFSVQPGLFLDVTRREQDQGERQRGVVVARELRIRAERHGANYPAAWIIILIFECQDLVWGLFRFDPLD